MASARASTPNITDVHSTPPNGNTSDGIGAAVIGGVVAAIIVVLICLLVVIMRYMYRHKGTYQTNEAKGTEFAESADEALKSDPSLLEDMEDNKKEYFI